MKSVHGRHRCWNRGTLHVHVALKEKNVSALQRAEDNLSLNPSTYLSRVLVHINVNDPSVFVALLDDIILDLHGPAGIIFSENEIGGH